MPVNVLNVVNDPKFQALGQSDQLGILGHLDSNFAALPDEDKPTVLTTLQKSALTRPDLVAPPGISRPQVNMQMSPLGKGYQGPGANDIPGSFEGHPENIGEWAASGPGQLGTAAKSIYNKQYAKGANEAIGAVSNSMLPFLPIAATASPLAVARAISGGYIAGKGAEAGANALGANPDQAELAGNLGNIVGGGLAAEPGPAIRGTGKALKTVGGHGARYLGAAAGEALGHPIIGYIGGRWLEPKIAALGERLNNFGIPKVPPGGPFANVPEPVPDPFKEADVINGEYMPEPQAPPKPQPKQLAGDIGVRTPYRYGPGEIPPEDVNAPDPRVLARNQGVIRTRLGFLPEYHPVSDSAMLNPETPRYTPKLSFLPGQREALEDASIKDAMQADLDSQGNAALAEEARQYRQRNDVSTPKWLSNAQFKANQVLEQAAEKQARPVKYTKTPPLSKFPTDLVQRMKAGQAEPNTLPPILKGQAETAYPKEDIFTPEDKARLLQQARQSQTTPTAPTRTEPTTPPTAGPAETPNPVPTPPSDDLTQILKDSLEQAKAKKGLGGWGALRSKPKTGESGFAANVLSLLSGRTPTGSTVPLMERPLPLEKPTIPNLADALNNFRKQQGLRPVDVDRFPDKAIARAKQIGGPEMKYQLKQPESGVDWYGKDIGRYEKAVAQEHPELNDPFRMAIFKAINAGTSLGNKSESALTNALDVFKEYKSTGKIPLVNPKTGKGWPNGQYNAYQNSFKTLQSILDNKGEQETAKWLSTQHPISELRQFNKNVAGNANDMEYGAVALGPKAGPFFLNMSGVEQKLTADVWMTRTWNRWMGTAFGENGEMVEAPRNEAERSTMGRAVEQLAKQWGISTRDAQAVLWNYEQKLYTAHGIPSEQPSYGTAAEAVVKRRMGTAKPRTNGEIEQTRESPTVRAGTQ